MMIHLQLLLALQLSALVAATAAAAAAAPPAAAGGDVLPVCRSCEAYCAGTCSLAGPPVNGAPNSRTRQNLTVYRMTAANTTGLVNKDTGDAAGDLVFNMGERGRPMECRHAPSPTMCDGETTQSWLLQSSLVYLEYVVEVDGNWGPYEPCNLNITNRLPGPGRGQPGDRRWHCGPPRVILKDNLTDAALCRTCPRALAAVGWEDQNHSAGEYSSGRGGSASAACNATARSLCAGQLLGNYSACRRCLDRQRHNLTKAEACGGTASQVFSRVMSLCPKPLPPTKSCTAAARRLCGEYRASALRHNCSRCLESGASRVALGPRCRESLLESRWCPAPARPDYNSNLTWLGWRPNTRLIATKLGGSWFSTPAAGECKGDAVPGDGTGCSWRTLELKKAVNYSCVQANVAAAVMARNPQCFSTCADGHRRDPPDPTDCWLRCFFNT
jgi:hypothetical protein